MRVKYILLLMFMMVLAVTQVGYGQANLSGSDLSNVRASEVTDAQLRSFMSRAESEGMTVDQALQIARQRGLRASEASQLRQRLSRLQGSRIDSSDPGDQDLDRLDRQLDMGPVLPTRIESELMRRTFGSSVFRTRASEFTPLANVPTPVSYTLGAGDELLITIWGDQIANYRLAVGPDGTVVIDNLGPVLVSGLSIKEADEVIRESLKQIFAGMRESGDRQTTFARVSINRLRSIQVAVTGDVVFPGNYAIPSSSTAFNALYRAGGPAENGSYRNVRVVRGNEIVASMDLYDFLTEGIQTGNIHLRDGDVVHVMPYKNRVEVIGEAKRGDLYFELLDGETLQDLIRYSGGFSENAFRQQVRIHRNTPTERRIITVPMARFDEAEMHNGDVVFIDELLDRFQNRVAITGAVWRSGDFELSEGMTLLNLIEQANGLRPDAFMNRGLINRMRDDYTFEQISFDLSLLFENPDRYDILMRPEDQVRIHSIHNLNNERTVEIDGAVRNGGAFPFRENMTLEDLILKADGFHDSASEARIEIARRVSGEAAPDQRSSEMAEVFIFQVDRNLSLSDEDARFILQPFDRVQVYRRPNYREQITVTIEGQVMYPGIYTLSSRNERVSDLIQRAGGLTTEAYVSGARLVRKISSIDRPEVDLGFLGDEDVLDEDLFGFGEFEQREREEQREQENQESIENNRSGYNLSDIDKETDKETDEERSTLMQRSYLNRLTRIEQQQEMQEEESLDRRIGLDLERILRSPGTAEDLYLREGDVIRIPEEQQTVAIVGAVMQDVEVRYRDGRGFNYYISRAGGFSENARSSRAYIVYANGDVDRRKRILFGLIKSNPNIEPGAQIIVPEKLPGERLSTAQVISLTSSAATTALLLLTLIDRLGN